MKRSFILMILVILTTGSCLFTSTTVYAVTAYPKPIRYTQPDGTTLTLLLKGDEFIHWAESPDGYTLLSNKNGGYEYASRNADGRIGFSGILAHDPEVRNSGELNFLASIQRGIFFTDIQIAEMKEALRNGRSPNAPLTGGFPTTGTRKLLVILANFSNTTTTYTQMNFENYMNMPNYNGTGSFKDYYLEVSYGQLIVNTTVTTWVTLPNPHDYYGPSSMWGQFALDAVTAANNQAIVDFSEFDNNSNGVVDGVAIFHQGQGQEESGNTNDIWSHSWELSSAGFSAAQRTFDGVQVDSYTTMPEKNSSGMGTIGVMCHEFGHNLGAMDYYDTDYSTGGQYNGTGYWDLMASGSWNGNSGDKPAHPNAYIKAYDFGWTTPSVVSTAQTRTLRNAEVYKDVIRYNTTTSNEYFLCENRQQSGFDIDIPGHGLIIYHVDGNYIASHSYANDINAGSHQGMYPVCASASGNPPTVYGTINSTGCPFPGTSSRTSFTDATTPHSHSWAGANTNVPVTNITENTTTKEVTFCLISCSTTPVLFTTAASSVTFNSAVAGGNVTSAGSSAVTARGVCWSASANPTISDSHTTDGSGLGTFTSSLTGLVSGTTYHLRAYATNSNGTSYGEDMTFTTLSTPVLSVTPSNRDVSSAAGTTTFSVTSNRTWTVSSDQAWCTVFPVGSGNGTITPTYSGNPGVTQRVATLTITITELPPITVTITQSGASPNLTVSPSNQHVPTTAGSTTFSVTSNTSWTVASSQAWCTVTPSGNGNGTITANFTANTLSSPRIALVTVTVSGLTPIVVYVTQAGTEPFQCLLIARNLVQTSPATFEFDIYIQDADPAQIFELASTQAGILLNPGIYNGGTLSCSLVAGSSELPVNQQPTTVTFTQSSNAIKMAGRVPPGPGNGAIIPATIPGTRITRLKVTNTVPFTAESYPELEFTSSVAGTSPYPTRVAEYISGINTQLLITPGGNAITETDGIPLNGPPALTVTPATREVGTAAGSISFALSSNTSWTASSDQSWCTLSSSSGYGSANLEATYTENTGTSPRTAQITVTASGLSPVVVTVIQDGISVITVNLHLFLEGLYDGTGQMRQAQDESGAHFTAPIADKLTVEVHDGANYGTLLYTVPGVDLLTSGLATFTVPGSYNGTYYLTIIHRNTLLTVTSTPLSFSGATVNYNFSDQVSKVYGSNQVLMLGGDYAFYGGDNNQDGFIDTADMSAVDNLSALFETGYYAEDINGDGFVDTGDMTILDNNSSLFIYSMTP